MPTREIATRIVKKLVDAGHTAYFAGGWVRDYLMQHPSDDIDIATSASTEEVEALFSKTIPVGIAFGIIIVVEDGHPFEVATFRKEAGYKDGRRPTSIERTTPKEDAQRRDFTINGMFFDPLAGTLYDYVGGEQDLKKGIIRAIGDPHERFLEDRLRMMRAVRYSTRFDFPIESDTLQAILAHAEDLLPAVAMERVWQEFKKMSKFAHFDAGLVTLHRLKLLPTIFPMLKDVSVEEIEKRIEPIEHYPPNPPTIAELLELFPDHSLDDLIDLCEMLKLSRDEKDFVEFLHHAQTMLSMPLKWQKELELIEWAVFYAHPHAEVSLQIISARLSPNDRAALLDSHHKRMRLLEQAIKRIRSKSPIVRSDDLKKEGIEPGVKMGQLLKEAERISVNESLENRDEILSKLKKSSIWKSK